MKKFLWLLLLFPIALLAQNYSTPDILRVKTDANGYLVNAKSRKNQTEAKQLLEGDFCFYGELVNGFDTHDCLLIIAYPNKDI